MDTNVSIWRRMKMDGRLGTKKVQSSTTSFIILPRRGRMMKEVVEDSLQESYPTHSSYLLVPRRSTRRHTSSFR